jgi:tRNA-intron lyase
VQASSVPAIEVLQLGLEEAFYLSYSCSRLSIFELHDKTQLSHEECWQRFSLIKPSFASFYATYHHFRESGFVVRSGIKFGADFALYNGRPETAHAQ